MQIGIGLPASIPGVKRELILDWARRAEAGPFSSLGIIDRLVYPNLEAFTTLAVVAGATERIRLMTTVMIVPLRSTGILAKEAATLDVLSNGRLTLGMGVGGREDDFRAAPAAFHNRGKHFEEQLTLMKRIWLGEAVDTETGPIGPTPVRQGGPEVLIGGYSPAALRRVGRWGDGIILGGSGDPNVAQQFYSIAQESWQAAGRSGKPRFVACMYYALGPDARERGGTYIRDYYSFMGQRADFMANAFPATSDDVRKAMDTFRAIGIDEVVFWSTIPDLSQVDLLAELVS
jgi:alkanesulfonate monooxygenase SsuD/methylene tetrahydromethanopterin reductase-like flavin-dependent oxidoreductase (luciferase family)